MSHEKFTIQTSKKSKYKNLRCCCDLNEILFIMCVKIEFDTKVKEFPHILHYLMHLCVGAFLNEWKVLHIWRVYKTYMWLFEWEKRKIIDFHFHFHWAVVTFKILWLWPWYAICSCAKKKYNHRIFVKDAIARRLHYIQGFSFNIFITNMMPRVCIPSGQICVEEIFKVDSPSFYCELT